MANVNFVLDEAASLGPNMTCVEDAINLGRGYGIRLQLYFQNLAQLKRCYGDQDATVLANTTQIFFAVNDSSAEYVSQRLGEQTIVTRSGGGGSSTSAQSGSSGQSNSSSISTSHNSNWNPTGRRLLKPEEILTLDERIALIFVPGVPPIWTRLQRHYEGRVASPRFPRIKVLAGASFVLLATTCSLVFGVSILEALANVRPVSCNEEIRGQSLVGHRRGSQATRYPRRYGIRVRTFQRPRVRYVRPRSVHPARTTGGLPPGPANGLAAGETAGAAEGVGAGSAAGSAAATTGGLPAGGAAAV